MENDKTANVKFMTREQLLELAKNYEPISVQEEGGSGSILRQFCIGAYSSMKGFKRTRTNTSESAKAASAVRNYVRKTPEFQKVMRFVGMGSSRITFALQDGSALKFAYNQAGIAQNKKEIFLVQQKGENSLPCFPKVYDHTDDWRGMLVECCSPISEEDFRVYRPLGDFQNLTMAIQCIVDEKKLFFRGNTLGLAKNVTYSTIGKYLSEYIEGTDKYTTIYGNFVDSLLNSEKRQWNSLRSLIQILFKFSDDSVMADLMNMENWGLAIDRESGEVTPVVVDMGFDRRIYNKFY